MKKIPFFLCLVLLLSLSGCAGRINLEEATKSGASQLPADRITTLVAGNSLHMASWDKADEADIDFSENGSLSAINSVGDKTEGRWSTDDEQDTLCLNFRFWGDGDTNCFKVFQGTDHYLLFNNDGTLASTIVSKNKVAPSQAIDKAVVVAKLHQQLLDTGECPGCNLAGVDFGGSKLKGVNLEGADLSGANLEEVNLSGANLKGANLQGARLTDALLSKTDLENANLSDANLHWANLSKANLKNANLERAYLIKAYFYKADLTGANLTGVQSQRAIFDKAIGVPGDLLPQKETPQQ